VPVALLAGRDCVEAAGGADPAASWATAFVSGAAALVWSAHPDESAEQIAYRLTTSADRPVRAQRDDTRGWGVVNAYEAVAMTPDPARAGPPLPGASAPVVQETVPPVDTGDPLVDPLAGARAAVVWWGLLGAAGLGLLLLLTRWNRLATGRARPDRPTP
jgi:membrane-anchored mycosin MYCP